MKPIFMGALIAGGAYFLLKDNIGQFFSGTSTTPAASTTTAATTPAATTPAASTITPAAAILATLRSHITASGAGATMNSAQGPDTWNYYLAATFPKYTPPAPEDIFPGKANVREPVTIEQWYAAIAPLFPAAGLSGSTAGQMAPAVHRFRAGRQAWS